jgi:hypothetical protein
VTDACNPRCSALPWWVATPYFRLSGTGGQGSAWGVRGQRLCLWLAQPITGEQARYKQPPDPGILYVSGDCLSTAPHGPLPHLMILIYYSIHSM